MIKNWLNKYNLLFNQFAFVEDILLGTEVTGGGNFVVFQHSVDVVFRKSAQGLKQFFSAAATAKTVIFTFGDAQIVGVEQAVQQLFRGQFGVKNFILGQTFHKDFGFVPGFFHFFGRTFVAAFERHFLQHNSRCQPTS